MTMALDPQWASESYRLVLLEILQGGSRIVATNQPELGARAGDVWLRHDVELSLEAALIAARIESGLSVSASYFLCLDSPFLANDAACAATAVELIALGHHVGLHLICRPNARREDLLGERALSAGRIGIDAACSVTLHCPGQRDSRLLAAMAPSPYVYDSYVDDDWMYLSDATGRWRYGSPSERLTPGHRPTQLLTHPYWWTLGSGLELDVSDAARREFLPQYFGAQPAPIGA
jgi:hypothetical protein